MKKSSGGVDGRGGDQWEKRRQGALLLPWRQAARTPLQEKVTISCFLIRSERTLIPPSRYFNAEFQRQQGEQERREGRGREDEEERRRVSQSSGGPPRDHRYEQAMRAHFEGQARPPGPAGHQEQVGGPRPQGPHFRGVPYSETPRQRPQMFPGGPQGYPGPPQGPQDQGRGDFGPRGHPMGPHHRGPPPPQGPQGYPGPPHYNPQQAMAMQAMAYR